MEEQFWYLYILECGDGSYYCGITTNVEKRVAAHTSGKGARYTRGRGPLKVLWKSKEPMTKSAALKLELKIKAMNREQKQDFMFRAEHN